jgi:predicted DCC family thiol-disulfide oxidoreductase YuxK
MQEETAYPILLYDGVCGFCNQTVRTILKHDTQGTMRFAPLQSGLGTALKARHHLEEVDSLILVDRSTGAERVFIRSNAALQVARYLGGWWKLLAVFSIVPRPLRDLLYDVFARYRYRLFGKYESCQLPSPEMRRRFLDEA